MFSELCISLQGNTKFTAQHIKLVIILQEGSSYNYVFVMYRFNELHGTFVKQR